MTIARRGVGALVFSALLVVPVVSFAQESKSAPFAAELARLLDSQKLDVIAARESPDQYVSAMYFPGTQLLVVRRSLRAPRA